MFKAGGVSQTLEGGLPGGRGADDRKAACLQPCHAKSPQPVARPIQVGLGSFFFVVKNVLLVDLFLYFSSINHASYVPVRSYFSVLLFCSSACRNLRMIDVEDFHTRKEPIELFVFQKMISTRVDRVQGILLNRPVHLWSRHTLENERCDFTASVLDLFITVTQFRNFFVFYPQLAPWCARYLLWREQKTAGATVMRTRKPGVFLQLAGCADDVSAAGVCSGIPEGLHQPHFPCRRHRTYCKRDESPVGTDLSVFSVSCSRRREPTGTLGLCSIWFWRTVRSGSSLNSDCTRRPSSMCLSWFSALPTWCLVWTPCCSLTG